MSSNRKFEYGDGFFETLIVKNYKVLYFEDHYNRITNACKTLKLVTSEKFKTEIHTAILDKTTYADARIKIQFWRDGKGKYTPETNSLAYSIQEDENTSPFFREFSRLEFCKTSFVTPTPFSSFKCFLLPYIIAGIEKSEKNVDDLILLNNKNEITETISSNLFWIKNNTFYTPNLDTGCLHGIMRKQLITLLKSMNIILIEGLFSKKDIDNSDFILTTNVTGITIYKNTMNSFITKFPFIKKLSEL